MKTAIGFAAPLHPQSVQRAPGHGNPVGRDGFATKDEFADYLEERARRAGLPIRLGVRASGAEIALELAATHSVSIAGRPTPHIPDAVFRFAGAAYWPMVDSVLTTDTRPGRKVAATFHKRGAPLTRVSMPQLERAGVRRLPRITGVSGGHPVAGEAGVVPCSTVIWATGYRPDLSSLPPVPTDGSGFPVTDRGVVESVPGLYFVRMPFQYALTSGLIGGVGRDAEFVAAQVEGGSRRSPSLQR